MGSVFERKGSWVGEFRVNGKTRFKTFGKRGVVTKTMAREMLRKIEQKVKLGQYDMLDANIPTLNEFAKGYVGYQRDVKQIRSHGRTREAINHFGRFYGNKKLSEITAEDVDIYKQRRLEEGVKLGTIKRELNVIRHLFNQGRKWKKFFTENPVSASGMPEVHDQKERVLTLGEQQRLFETIPAEFKDIIRIALNTGMRLGEVLSIRWGWIDFEENLITLPLTHTKSKKENKVPVNPVTRRILLERKLQSGGNESVFPSETKHGLRAGVQRAFKEACKRAGIANMRFHDLRHTVGTRLGESGVPIQTISKLLGHTSTRMTERYVHPEESVKRATDILADFSERGTDKADFSHPVTDKFTDNERGKS